MTVAELITALAAFPPDALVITEAYESDYDPAAPPSALDVYGPDPDAPPYFGDYAARSSTGYAPDFPCVHAVLISRYGGEAKG